MIDINLSPSLVDPANSQITGCIRAPFSLGYALKNCPALRRNNDVRSSWHTFLFYTLSSLVFLPFTE